MKLDSIRNKTYEVPLNVPSTTIHKYVEVIEKGYAKYLEAIDLCGKFIMYKQFYKLVGLFEPNLNKDESRERIGRFIIRKLEKLGFIFSSNINKNKFLYLKKPGLSFSAGDYKNSSRVTLSDDLKNDRFQISIMKVEYLLEHGEIIHNTTMFNQLMNITNHIYNTIVKTGNNYGYSCESIERVMEFEGYQEIFDFLEKNSEFEFRLGIIRSLWKDLGSLYRKLLLQKQTITHKPEYYKLFVKKDGEVMLHYIPSIIIFDASHDKKYYKDRAAKLFHAFYGIDRNNLRDVQKAYLFDKTMGYQGEHHIGYKLILIGTDEEVLNQKKAIIDEDINVSSTSPLMDYTIIVPLPIGNYILHASRKGSEYQIKQDEMIDNLILKQITRISESSKPKKKAKDITNQPKEAEVNNTSTIVETNTTGAQRILGMVSGD